MPVQGAFEGRLGCLPGALDVFYKVQVLDIRYDPLVFVSGLFVRWVVEDVCMGPARGVH